MSLKTIPCPECTFTLFVDGYTEYNMCETCGDHGVIFDATKEKMAQEIWSLRGKLACARKELKDVLKIISK